jgi:uncharacterized protein (TIGR00369 family)
VSGSDGSDARESSHLSFRRSGAAIGKTFGYRVTEFGDGKCLVEWRPVEPFVNVKGGVWGGAVAAVVDNVCAMAVAAALDPAPAHLPTVSMHVDYLRALPANATYFLHGQSLRVGGRLAVADTLVTDVDGLLFVRATCTFAIRR